MSLHVLYPFTSTTMRNFGIPKARGSHDISAVTLKVTTTLGFDVPGT